MNYIENIKFRNLVTRNTLEEEVVGLIHIIIIQIWKIKEAKSKVVQRALR